MRTTRAVRWVRAASAVAFAVSTALFGASCRGIWGVGDDYKDSVEALCSIVDRCSDQGGCQDRVQGKLDAATPEPWTQWLSDLGSHQCLEGCGNARRCLDTLPLCGDSQCARKEDCCGFISGRVDCDLGSGQCCKPAGVKCTSNDECCPGSGPCSLASGTCGGVVCKDTDQLCANSFECCSNVCRDGKCSDEICGEKGFECATNDECCSGFCDAATGTGRCAEPVCGIAGFTCAAASDCCSGLFCAKIKGEVTGVCSTCESALPNGVDCGANADCCSGYCNESFFQCGDKCAKQDEACAVNTDCCDGVCVMGVCQAKCPSTCVVNEDCCSQKCVNSQCLPDCANKGSDVCTHNTCTIGAPLNTICTTCTASQGCTVSPECVKNVCDADPYCCCTSWDSLCVLEAHKDALCSPTCK